MGVKEGEPVIMDGVSFDTTHSICSKCKVKTQTELVLMAAGKVHHETYCGCRGMSRPDLLVTRGNCVLSVLLKTLDGLRKVVSEAEKGGATPDVTPGQ